MMGQLEGLTGAEILLVFMGGRVEGQDFADLWARTQFVCVCVCLCGEAARKYLQMKTTSQVRYFQIKVKNFP